MSRSEKLRAGDLIEAVTIQDQVTASNAFGEITITWEDFANRRCDVRDFTTGEQMRAQGPYAVASHEVTFRYVPGIKPSMRLVWNSRTPNRILDIVSISDRDYQRYHTVIAKEHAP